MELVPYLGCSGEGGYSSSMSGNQLRQYFFEAENHNVM
jgi:hypothetical protein